jgi:prolyl 4-hydroxylase
MRIPGRLEILEKPNFLHPSVVEFYISMMTGMGSANVHGDQGSRRAECTWVRRPHLEDLGCRSSILAILGSGVGDMEPTQLVRYPVGGFYGPHYDFFAGDVLLSKGYQRIWTCLAYLNDDFVGGETVIGGRTIVPEKGKLVIWNNILEDGSPCMESIHESLANERTEKMIAITWIVKKVIV